MGRKRKALTRDEIAKITSTNLEQSQGWNEDALGENMRQALNYYLGREPQQRTEGVSDLISMDVADTVESVLAQMLPSITGDSSVMFEAEGLNDEAQADMESDAVNIVIHDRNHGFTLFLEAVKNALLLKTGIIKVYTEDKETTTTDTFEGLNDIELAETVVDNDPGVEIEVLDQRDAGVGEQGEQLTDVVVQRTVTRTVTKLASVLPENFSVYANYNKLRLTRCPFVSERHFKRRAELVEMGFSKRVIFDLPATNQHRVSQLTRNIAETQDAITAGDASQEMVEAHQCFQMMDRNGNGREELLEIWIGGEGPTVLLGEPEPVDFTPYAIGSPFINPGRWLGYSLFDKVASIQDSKTEAIRTWADNMANNTVGRTEAVVDQVNMDDLGDKRTGGVVRVKSPGMIRDLPVTDIGPSVASFLEYQDKMRGERAGASLDMQSGDAQLIGSQIGSQGVDRIYSTKEQLAGMMTNTLAHTLIRSTYLLVHATLRSNATGKLSFKKAGDWVETDPSTWPARERVDVTIGASAAERARRSGSLEKVVAFQAQLMQGGKADTMVNDAGMYAAMKDWARSVQIPTPEQYFIDPSSKASQAAAKQKAEQAAAAQQKAEQAQQQVLAFQMQLQQAQISAESQRKLWELQFKYFDAVLKSEVDEAKILGDQINTELQGLQQIGQQQSAAMGAASNGSTGAPGGV